MHSHSVLSNSLCPMNCSLPGSSVYGNLQARILECVAISSSRESSWPKDQTLVSFISCTGRWILYCCVTGAEKSKIWRPIQQEVLNTAAGVWRQCGGRIPPYMGIFPTWETQSPADCHQLNICTQKLLAHGAKSEEMLEPSVNGIALKQCR